MCENVNVYVKCETFIMGKKANLNVKCENVNIKIWENVKMWKLEYGKLWLFENVNLWINDHKRHSLLTWINKNMYKYKKVKISKCESL